MSDRKHIVILVGFVLSVSLIASAFTTVFLTDHYRQAQFDLLGAICREIIEEEPEAEQAVAAAIKEYRNHMASQAYGRQTPVSDALKEYKKYPASGSGENILSELGYRSSDFAISAPRQSVLFAGAGFLLGSILFCLTFLYRSRKEKSRIEAAVCYLEQVNTGKAGLTFPSGEEDHFSKLEDEIYKTVTMLYQTRDAALEEKNKFAENLSNIAHQLKTPITAISLSTQMMKENSRGEYSEQIRKSLDRLTYLEEALLILSQMDSGTLSLEKRAVDVFTVLMLSADNLEELLVQSEVSVDIPELGEMEITADLDWTMEAVMNLIKNCMEHTPPGGMVHCSYDKNPLYTEILIWDEGEGFAKEDIPHLFERFYRGCNAGEGGIGIGLSLAKEIIEMQNGTIRAKNIPDGGACFEIRFYAA